MPDATCPLCGHPTDSLEHRMEQRLIRTIRHYNPQWVEDDGSCGRCVRHYGQLAADKPIV